MMTEFNERIKPLADELGHSLGIKTIEVKEIHSENQVEVTKYVKCINPFGEEVFLSEQQYAKAELLGLSVRKA